MALNGASNANDKLLCQHSVSCFKAGYLYFHSKLSFQHFCRVAEESKPNSINTRHFDDKTNLAWFSGVLYDDLPNLILLPFCSLPTKLSCLA